MFEIINTVVRDPKNFLWIASYVADSPGDNPNDTKTLSARSVRTFLINGKFKNPPSCLVLFVVVYFTKIFLFSKDLITFIISFISLLVKVIPKPLID